MYLMSRKKKKDISVSILPRSLGKPYQIEFEGVFYRTYSFLDLLNLVHVRNQVRRGEKIHIPDETLLSVYEGNTFFSLFQYNPEVLD